MSALYDMISAFIAMLISAALLHFGAAGESHPAMPVASISHAVASSAAAEPDADPVIDDHDDDDTMAMPAAHSRHHPHHLSAHGHRHGAAGGQPVIDAVRAPSPLRHG